MLSIPTSFSQTIIEVYQEAGLKWLQDLPLLIKKCEQRWLLKVEAPFAALSYNYVAPAVRTESWMAILDRLCGMVKKAVLIIVLKTNKFTNNLILFPALCMPKSL